MFEAFPDQPIAFVGALLPARPGPVGASHGRRHIGCSNGLAWSPDSRTMYFADSHAGLVWAYDFDALSGGSANRRIPSSIMSNSGGIADGATVDAEGCYWLTVPRNGIRSVASIRTGG
jgi:L-arabinonolactonase